MSSIVMRQSMRRAMRLRPSIRREQRLPGRIIKPHQSSIAASTNVAQPLSSYFSTAAIGDEQKRQRFDELEIHPKSLKVLHRHGLYRLTEIQEKTFDVIVSGKDVVGRARTGTGKTLSFLLPALERIVRSRNDDYDTGGGGIQLLILSPTRELAAQIAKEAERLVAQHDSSITSQVVYGGSSKREDIERFNTALPTILVATPGRLKDHLASTRLKKGLFIDAVQNLQTLVLDETDRLLDMGFRRDIQDILACLPQKKRQTLLFSATLPTDVESMIQTTIRPNYRLIDCIQEEDPATHTNAQTEQSYVVLPSKRFWNGSIEVLLKLMDAPGDKKIMVFFPMTSLVQLYASIFNMRFGRRVFELHGKMHQRSRDTISRRFRNSKNGILFTSDVSARGVDYPNVTHVVQIGAANSRETYIHRLGRTGRAGKVGNGLLILPELESSFLKELDGLNIPRDDDLHERLAKAPSRSLQNELGPLAQAVRAGRDPDITRQVNDAYQAMIAFYFQKYKNDEPQRYNNDKPSEIVSTINSLADDLGLRELPAIDKRRAQKIGLDILPGINIKKSWGDQNVSGSWGASAGEHKKPFGKPYGDFEGKFPGRGNGDATGRVYRDDRNRGREDSKESPTRKASYGDRPQRSRHQTSEPRDQFAKVGWSTVTDFKAFKALKSDDNKRGVSPPRKKGTFQRWESPGEYNFIKR
jgi:ATP-dependent RNA helicase MSS116